MLFAHIRRIRWVGHAARLLAKHTNKFQSRNWNRSGLGVGRRITVERYSKKLSLKMWAEFVCFRTWCISLGLHIEWTVDSLVDRGFCEQLSDCFLRRTPCNTTKPPLKFFQAAVHEVWIRRRKILTNFIYWNYFEKLIVSELVKEVYVFYAT